MSTSYGLRCKDCGADTATNFREFALVEILKARTHLEALYKSEGYSAGFDIKIQNDYEEPYVLDFLSQHKDHELIVVSEYGQEICL